MRGGVAGFLAGTLGGLAGLVFWLTTNLFGLPSSLLPFGFETAIFILTVEYAVFSLSAGVIGSVVISDRFPDIIRMIKHHRPSFPGLSTTPVELEKRED